MRHPLIIALDPFLDSLDSSDLVKWCSSIVDETIDYVTGYKIGLPLVLRIKNVDLEKIVENMKNRGTELVIADLKLADIGEVMVETVKPLVKIGINTYIAHSFIGYSSSLDILKKYLDKNNCRLITILSMTHPGSNEVIDKNTNKLINIILKTKPWGVVVAAHKKKIIKKIKRETTTRGFDLKVLTPGIGVQGSEPGTGLKNGADYEIIGRLITTSMNPREKLVELINKYYRWIP